MGVGNKKVEVWKSFVVYKKNSKFETTPFSDPQFGKTVD